MNTQLQTRSQTSTSLRSLVDMPAYKDRFRELLKDRAPQFVASMVQMVNASPQLQKCEPNSIIAACITAAALDLPIERNLGFAHIVPYGEQAQFQLGYKGFIQLAVRTGQYRFINCAVVYEGELEFHNKLTSEITLKPENKKSDKIFGYTAYFKLSNGFEHAVYWDAATVEAHARRYSKAYAKGYETPWKSDFDKMALKTVIKDLLSHWGILSVEMQRALGEDQAVRANVDALPEFPDNTPEIKSPDFGNAPQLATPATKSTRRKPTDPVVPPATAQQTPETQHDPAVKTPAANPELEKVQKGLLKHDIMQAQVLLFLNTKGKIEDQPEYTSLDQVPKDRLKKLGDQLALENSMIVSALKAVKVDVVP